jgi:epoxyqueuosine reductase QueG
MENIAQYIKDIIGDFIASKENSMKKWDDEPAWANALVGFSNGADPIFPFFKEDIGNFYLQPLEILSQAYPEQVFKSEQISVISWILPQTDATKRDHRKETHFPSERWARSRIFGEQANVKLRQHVVRKLYEINIEAVAPLLSPLYKSAMSEKYAFASRWSERHTAYASGLGTFGLSDGLITTKGKAMRTGSVIANVYLEPTLRPYEDHNAYCLFHQKGTCGECIERCPIGAISEKGHDKYICSRYVNMTRKYVPKHYGFDGYGCGFCQTGVCCESGIPKELQ